MPDTVLDLYLLGKARDAAVSASQAAIDAQRVSADTREVAARMEERVERLTLLTLALGELLIEGGVLSEADLQARIAAIDLRDGRADGRLGERSIPCAHCGRTKSAGRPRCVWCGRDTPVGLGGLGG